MAAAPAAIAAAAFSSSGAMSSAASTAASLLGALADNAPGSPAHAQAAANVAAWAALPQPAKGMLVQAWTSVAAVFGTLPATQRLLRAYGFFRGGGSEKAKAAIATALTAGTFGVAVAVGPFAVTVAESSGRHRSRRACVRARTSFALRTCTPLG